MTSRIQRMRFLPPGSIVVVAAFAWLAVPAYATRATLEWEPLPEADIAGYRLYFGSPAGTFDQIVETGMSTKYCFENLDPTRSFSFRVVAYNSAGFESQPSLPIHYPHPANSHSLVAFSDTGIVAEDEALNVPLTGLDVYGRPISYSLKSLPLHGLLLGQAPDLVYVPDPEYYGEDGFSFTIRNGLAESAPANVSLVIYPVDDPPQVTSETYTVDEDGVVAVNLKAFDPDGDSLSFVLATPPRSGQLMGTPPNLLYLPSPDLNGTDTFTFKVRAASAESSEAAVTLLVTPREDPPQAFPQNLVGTEDDELVVILNGADPDGNALNYDVVRLPRHGELLETPPGLVYRPASNFFGADSFAFKVNDGEQDSPPAEIALLIVGRNDPPIAESQVVSGAPGRPLNIRLSAKDAEADTLSYVITGLPSKGGLSSSPPPIVYTPANGFRGTDTFSFIANDGQSSSSPAVVTVHITSDAPPEVAGGTANLSRSGNSYSPLSINLSATDRDTKTLNWQITKAPRFGTLIGTPPALTYMAGPVFYGVDKFSFRVSDGTSESSEADFWVRDPVITQPSPPIRIQDLSRPGFPGFVRITLAGVPGVTPSLECSRDFNEWIPVFTGGEGEGLSVDDGGSGTTFSSLVYRARLEYSGP